MVPVLFRHYNALPIDPAANFGFGLHTITTHEHNGHNPKFAAGSMGPKVQAAVNFLEAGGARAVIAELDAATDALAGAAGTELAPG